MSLIGVKAEKTKDLAQHSYKMAQVVADERKRKNENESDEMSDNDSSDSDVSFLSGFKAKRVSRRADGCNITLNRKNGIYTWKSEKFPSFLYFIDLKIWTPAKAAKGEPLEVWKEAMFRAKLAFGNPMDKVCKEDARNFVQTLKRYITTQADTYDRVEKTFDPNKSKKKKF